jgi:hypothetical protein
VNGRRGGLWRQRNFALFDTLHASTFIVALLTAMAWIPWVIIGRPELRHKSSYIRHINLAKSG